MIDLTSLIDDTLHDAVRKAAAEGPIARDAGSGAVIALRHADVEALAHDPRLDGVGLAIFDLMGIGDTPLRRWYGSLMFTNEGAPHDRLRRLVSRAFTPRAVDRLRATSGQLADEAVAGLVAEGGGDLAKAFRSLPARVMCRLLGVPDADVAQFESWVDALSRIFGVMTAEQVAAADVALEGLLGYVGALADERRDDPADDLITALWAAESESDRLTRDELVTMVANLLVGGHDTTASQLGCTLLTLLRHPDEAARVRAEPELVASAATETIRFEPSIVGIPRVAREATTVAGETVPAGTLLMLATVAANREPGVWDEPDRFDVARFTDPRAPRLLSFGAGPHYCLGAALARMTVEAVVRAVSVDAPVFTPIGDPWQTEWRTVLGRSPVSVPVEVSGG